MTANHDQASGQSMPTDAWDGHIHSFDLARLVAALSVVLFHWQEFAVKGRSYPFSSWLIPFYKFGALSVPLFFSLSGFVFTWLYADTVNSRRVGTGTFFVTRVSRLYPLFFLTFLAAAVAIPYCRTTSPFSFSYLHTDGYHAALTMFMLNGWGFENGFSFNGPSWSVSTEMFLYAAFFVVARTTKLSWRTSVMMIGIGVAVTPISVHIAGGLAQFFAGSLAYRGFQLWAVRRRYRWIAATVAAGGACVCVYAWEYHNGSLLMLIRAMAHGMPNIDTRYQILRDLILAILFFPSVVFVLAAIETDLFVKRLLDRSIVRWSGDISYAVYLCHFPLMMICAIAVGVGGLTPEIFYNPATLIVYLVVLLGVSHLSFHGFERPAMRLIRSVFKRRVPSAPLAA